MRFSPRAVLVIVVCVTITIGVNSFLPFGNTFAAAILSGLAVDAFHGRIRRWGSQLGNALQKMFRRSPP